MAVKPRVVGGAAAVIIAVALSVASAFVGPREGERFTAYDDGGGVWTICKGHTRGVRKGDTATDTQCEAWFQQDLGEANEIVDRCITVPMNANQRAALISFAFNEGAGGEGVKDGLCILKNGREPLIRRMANANRWREACDGLLDWARAGGVQLFGLLKRRRAERELCMKPS